MFKICVLLFSRAIGCSENLRILIRQPRGPPDGNSEQEGECSLLDANSLVGVKARRKSKISFLKIQNV